MWAEGRWQQAGRGGGQDGEAAGMAGVVASFGGSVEKRRKTALVRGKHMAFSMVVNVVST